MKKITVLFATLLAGLTSFAQEVINVAPDYVNGGALNAAIATHGPNKIYKLEANGYYTLNASIELLRTNPGDWYQIVGEIPATDDDYMPVLQTGLTAENVPFTSMFNLKADLTIKNIFVANQTTTGQIGDYVFLIRDEVRLKMDGCVVDPVGNTDFINGGEFADDSDIYLTNNQFLRQGNPYSPAGGHMIRNVIADTLYIENNSFISTDHTIIRDEAAGERSINFVWFNHNTVIWHDVGLNTNYNNSNAYYNNNLFHDITNYVQLTAWNGDPDSGTGAYPSLKLIDTATVGGVNEALPSARTIMYNRNAQFVSDAVKDVLLGHGVNNPSEPLWLYPLMWNDETPHYFVTDWDNNNRGQNIIDDSRSGMFESSDFPNFVEDNTWYDTNPNFTDARIATHGVDVAESALYWYYANGILTGTNSGDQKSQFWDVDGWAGTSDALYPTVWPRWDGSYTNSALLTASTAGYPIGDLNAFPDQKAQWEGNKDEIMEHILSLETDQVELSVEEIQALDASFNMYPNPARDSFQVESGEALNSVRVYTMLGELVKVQDVNGSAANVSISNLASGMYIVEVIYAKGLKVTTKIIKE